MSHKSYRSGQTKLQDLTLSVSSTSLPPAILDMPDVLGVPTRSRLPSSSTSFFRITAQASLACLIITKGHVV